MREGSGRWGRRGGRLPKQRQVPAKAQEGKRPGWRVQGSTGPRGSVGDEAGEEVSEHCACLKDEAKECGSFC